ncbi:MAG: hypothetical protein GDA53_05145 [Rhodobacteraceae bacterium]|nr:hypothetical protein [Paracoccaceae bacterium]
MGTEYVTPCPRPDGCRTIGSRVRIVLRETLVTLFTAARYKVGNAPAITHDDLLYWRCSCTESALGWAHAVPASLDIYPAHACYSAAMFGHWFRWSGTSRAE